MSEKEAALANRFGSKEDIRRLAEGYGVKVDMDHDNRTLIFHGARAQEAINSVNAMFTAVPHHMKVAE